MDYSRKKDLGFKKEAILLAPIPDGSGKKSPEKVRTLREEMARVPGVELTSLSSAPPSSGSVSETILRVEGIAEEYITQVKQVDGNYVDLYKLELVAGRNIQDLDSANGFLVNEKLVRTVGIKDPQDIIGKQLTIWHRTYPVVGVVRDFHTVALRDPIEATALFNRADQYRMLALKIDLSRGQEIIAALKTKWEAAYPEQLFEYEFLDESIRRFYDGERRMSALFAIFSSIAIFIGCLGLYGLASFMTNQKTKEIGVRKVMGASVESIIFMFSKEYVKLIAIGFLLSAPLAWFAMNSFLGEFAYKIELGPGIFLLGLTITLLIALLTVGYKSFKSATVNPVESLRYE
jgi:putative ABC transport system permease protein